MVSILILPYLLWMPILIFILLSNILMQFVWLKFLLFLVNLLLFYLNHPNDSSIGSINFRSKTIYKIVCLFLSSHVNNLANQNSPLIKIMRDRPYHLEFLLNVFRINAFNLLNQSNWILQKKESGPIIGLL